MVGFDGLPQIRAGLLALQTPDGADTKFEEINIATPPFIVNLMQRSQELLLEADVAEHHEWLVRFSEHKALVVEHGHDAMPGSPNLKWYAMPSPSRLPFFLSRLPDTNSAHVLHSSVFVQPTVELHTRNMTSLATDMGSFLSAPLEETHDIQKILLSWVLPNQVQLDIIADSRRNRKCHPVSVLFSAL